MGSNFTFCILTLNMSNLQQQELALIGLLYKVTPMVASIDYKSC